MQSAALKSRGRAWKPGPVAPDEPGRSRGSSLRPASGDALGKISVDELADWQEQGPPTPLLDTVNFPVHIKNFNLQQLLQLCKELRAGEATAVASLLVASVMSVAVCCHAELIHTVAKTGGHLGSSLGVVELTVALHYVFNTPEDKFVWDVGHQAYIHKMLTGRKSRMSTIRQQGGLSGKLSSCCTYGSSRAHDLLSCGPGFTKRAESVYDAFGAGHSSTSVSAALGMAVGRDCKGRRNNVVAVGVRGFSTVPVLSHALMQHTHGVAGAQVIGDGAITGGMAYEAMNHAGFLDTNMIVILNDNQQVIGATPGRRTTAPLTAYACQQVSLPTQYNGKNQDPVGALSSTLARLQVRSQLQHEQTPSNLTISLFSSGQQAAAGAPRDCQRHDQATA